MAREQPDAESAIRALSDAFVRHFNAGDADRLVRAFYAEDARLLPPNGPIVTGQSQIGEALQGFLAAGFGEMAINTTEIASSGDLAYRVGTYTMGTPAPDRGKFIELYRRQADGSWKCVADMFSSDQTAS